MRRLAGWALLLFLYAALLPGSATAAGDPLRSQQWWLELIHADEAHAVSTGVGATVAVVDTGVFAAHPDLAGRVLPGIDFVDGDTTPQDGNGHGTHVSGIIAADAGNGVGVDSVAPGAKILPVRVLGDDGSGSDAAVAQGVDWASTHGADVINLSLGGAVPVPGGMDVVSAAVARAVDRGVIVVAAAGNDGLPFCENNSDAGKVLCVGAVDKRSQRSFYSSFGSGLSLVAPGGSDLPGADEDVLSTWNDGGYHSLAGTSQATPHVAGVAALLVSLGVRGQAAVQRILATATDLGTPGVDPVYGAGVVNAAAAVAGLGGSSGAGGGGAGPPGRAHVSISKRQRIRAVLRHGIRVRCRSPKSGTCSAVAAFRRRRLAAGSSDMAAGKTVQLLARPTRRGRAVLRSALHHHRTLRTTVTVRLPGATFKPRIKLIP